MSHEPTYKWVTNHIWIRADSNILVSCVYVCKCVCMCVWVLEFVHARRCLCVRACTLILVSVWVSLYMHVCTHTYKQTNKQTNKQLQIHKQPYIYTYTHAYIPTRYTQKKKTHTHTYIRTYMHAYMHTYILRHLSLAHAVPPPPLSISVSSFLPLPGTHSLSWTCCSCVTYDSYICETWLIHMWHIIYS